MTTLRSTLFAAAIAWGPWIFPVIGQSELTPELAERYEQLLIQSPQSGTAFDRVMEYYSTAGGGLEVLQKKWLAETEVASAPAERVRTHWLLLGMLAERQRDPGAARESYQAALDPADGGAGDLLVPAARLLAAFETTEGNFEDAVAAWELALSADGIAPADRLDLIRSLAMLHQRTFADDKAVELWKGAIKDFPNDPYVLEEAGEAFLSAGEFAEAREVFEQLRDSSGRDPFRRVSASLRLAQTLEMEDRSDDAVGIYLSLLDETSEGSWLQREVRARVENLFRRKDDLPGLLTCYEARVAAQAQDYRSLAAMSAVLEELGNGDEAVARLREATAMAPGETELRIQLVRLLVRRALTDEAIAEAVELARPGNAEPEVLLLLGGLYWDRWEAGEDADERQKALDTWARIAPEGSQDLGRIAQFAELLQSRGETDLAVAQWQRLVELSPGAADARQRLATIYIDRDDVDAAKAVLAGIVPESGAGSENFVMLAKAQDRLEWTEDARATVQLGLEQFPDDFELLGMAMRHAMDAEDTSKVVGILPRLWESAPNAFFAEDVIKRHVSFLTGSEAAGQEADRTRALVEGDVLNPLDLQILLRLGIAAQNEEDAALALTALKSTRDAISAARAEADFASAFGTIDDQIQANLAVAGADPRLAVESLLRVARLRADLGEIDAALEALDQAVERAPADASLIRSYAEIAAGAGRNSVAVAKLREAIRFVDDATPLRLQLAQVLTAGGETDDAAKVLQEALEAEPAEGRRMDIFRRQIELAMMTNSVDDLIASLRERQSQEQEGARYGAYLAEIFMMQNDFVSARDELMRGLGRNPDDAAAVARLLDLSERGGDRAEVVRLSARLLELEPTAENRAGHLTRILQNGDVELAMEIFPEVRAEMIANPVMWVRALDAMRLAGLAEESSAVIEEIAKAGGGDAETRYALANLRIGQRDFEGAEAILESLFDDPDFGEVIRVATASPAGPGHVGISPVYFRFQRLQQLSNEVSNAIQQAMQQRGGFSGGRVFGGFSGMRLGQAADPNAPSKAEQDWLRSLVMLRLLMTVSGEEEEFFERLTAAMDEADVSVASRILLWVGLNRLEGLEPWILEYASGPNIDAHLDQWILSNSIAEAPALKPAIEQIQARAAEAEPGLTFEREVNALSKKVGMSGDPAKLSDDVRSELVAELVELINDPETGRSFNAMRSLIVLAAQIGEFELAERLLADLEAMPDPAGGGGVQAGRGMPSPAAWKSQVAMVRNMLLGFAIRDGYVGAEKFFEAALKDMGTSPASFGVLPGGSYFFSHRGSHPLATTSGELVVGDAAFPFPLFQSFSQMAAQGKNPEALANWMKSRAEGDDLTVWQIGAAYADWAAKKEADAIARIERIHDANPTPRSAALLFEMYERHGQPDEALAVMELAALQPGETRDIRSLRELRLLRATDRTDEAKQLGGRLSRSRVSLAVRDQLQNELTSLGIPLNPLISNRSNPVFQRPNKNRAEVLQDQVAKLVDAERKDEAERIATDQLSRPFPTRHDYESHNVRSEMISTLKSMDRLQSWRASQLTKLEADPADAVAALRLLETAESEDSADDVKRVLEVLKADPGRMPDLGYTLQLIQNNNRDQNAVAELICDLVKRDPALLAKQGIDLQELPNYAQSDDGKKMLATTIAELDEADWMTLSLPTRLLGHGNETGMLSELAEMAVAADQPEMAIRLLNRAIDSESPRSNHGMHLPIVLRLAELQIEEGANAEATVTLRGWIESSPQNNVTSSNLQSPAVMAINQLIGSHHGDDTPNKQLERIVNLAKETGTFDLLIEKVEEDPFSPGQQLPLSLLLRTAAGMPGAAEEWKEFAQSEQIPVGMVSLPVLVEIVKALASDDDAGTTIPKFFKKLPTQMNQFSGGDAPLRMLTQLMPALGPLSSNAGIREQIENLVTVVLNTQNGQQHFVHNESYVLAIQALMQHGLVDQARQLFDFTAVERSRQHHSQNPALLDIQRRLALLDGEITEVNISLAGAPGANGKVDVHWQIQPILRNLDVPSGYGSGPSMIWESDPLPVSKDLMPVRIEILAGTNPMNLKPVATVSNPKQGESVSIDPPAQIGLLQAKWTMRDKSEHWGPLGLFVLGENAFPDASALKDQVKVSDGAISTDQPGPLGPQSASIFSDLSPGNQAGLPLAELDLASFNGLLVVSGWVSTGNGTRSVPYPTIRWTDESGQQRDERANSFDVQRGQWGSSITIRSVGESSERSFQTMPQVPVRIELMIQATRGVNSLFQKDGGWAGLQCVRIGESSLFPDVNELISKANSAQNSEPGEAVKLWFEALELNPDQTLRYSATSWLEFFQRSNQLDVLYEKLATPALYLGNPFRSGQTTIQDDGFISRLAIAASDPAAPASAKSWLKLVASLPLPTDQRFAIDIVLWAQASALSEASGSNSGQVEEAAAALGLLGFIPDQVNAQRVRQIWGISGESSPTQKWLQVVREQGLQEEIIEQVQAIQLPLDLQPSAQFLRAWMLVESDPEAALELWRQCVAARYGGQNSVSFTDELEQAFLVELSSHYENSGDLVAAVRDWNGRRSNDAGWQRRFFGEIIYPIYQHQKELAAAGGVGAESRLTDYRLIWLDAELALLTDQSTSPERDRIRDAAETMLDLGDWSRLGKLLELAKDHSSLQSTDMKNEFSLLEKLVALAKGDFTFAWPVSWISANADGGAVTFHWQWNVRDTNDAEGVFDAAISVADKPVLPTIAGQERIEIHFGATPAKLTKIAEISGDAAAGSGAIELPASVGFLRAVAVIGDRDVAGPMVPVISGRRIYPPDGMPMQTFFASGETPISSDRLNEDGAAPDGSPAYRFSTDSQNNQIEFIGIEFPVEPGKFYVQRIWLQRAGGGSESVFSEFRANKESGRRPLSMILADGQRPTGQWTLYTRAIPALPEHTFWIPYSEVVSVVPKFRNISSGTRFAAWELIEVNEWEYTAWIRDLAMLREMQRQRVEGNEDAAGLTADEIAKALELASIEPLTALDYHGRWLADQVAATDRGNELLDLFETALSAEANPLFARPKLNRIFGGLMAIAENDAVPQTLRREAVDLAIAQSWQAGVPATIGFYRTLLKVAEACGDLESGRADVAKELMRRVANWEPGSIEDGQLSGSEFFASSIYQTPWRNDEPVSDLLALLDELGRGEVLDSLKAQFSPGENSQVSDSMAAIIAIAMEACKPTWQSEQLSMDQVDAALAGNPNMDGHVAHLASVTGSLLASRDSTCPAALRIRQKLFDKQAGDERQTTSVTRTFMRFATNLLASAYATGDSELARSTAESIKTHIQFRRSQTQAFQEDSMRILVQGLEMMASNGHAGEAIALAELITPEAGKYPNIRDALEKIRGFTPGPSQD